MPGQAAGGAFVTGQLDGPVRAGPGTIGTSGIAPGGSEIELPLGPGGQGRIGLQPGHGLADKGHAAFGVAAQPSQAAVGQVS